MLIVFEGLDNTGKTTAINRARLLLSAKGYRTVTLSLPSACLYQDVVHTVMTKDIPVINIPKMVLLNYQTILNTINQSHDERIIYLVDRFYHSTFVYQGLSLTDDKITSLVNDELSFLAQLDQRAVLYDSLFYLYCDTNTVKERVLHDKHTGEYNKHFDQDTLLKRDRYMNRYRNVINQYSQHLRHDLGRKTFNINTSIGTGMDVEEASNRIAERILSLKG